METLRSIGDALRVAWAEPRVVGATPRPAGRASPRREAEDAPMTRRGARATVTSSTADHRSWENEMDAMTLMLLAISILLTLNVAAAQLR